MKYVLKLFREKVYLNSVIKTIIPNRKNISKDVSKFFQGELVDENDEPMDLYSPREVILYLFQKNILPKDLKVQLDRLVSTGFSLEDAVDSLLKTDFDLRFVLEKLTNPDLSDEGIEKASKTFSPEQKPIVRRKDIIDRYKSL